MVPTCQGADVAGALRVEGSMRVIAGSLKGRRLEAPTWEGLRPTSDKLRETLFNILAPRIEGTHVLDGYAGTGALGIEALSRGAVQVTFVEQDRRAQALIAQNLARCGVTNGYAIIRASATRALADFQARASAFDVILLDPPYGEDAAHVDAVLAQAAGVVTRGGVIVLEHGRKHPAAAAAGRLARTRDVISGDSVLTFYACPPWPSIPARSIR
jgi:16S rRNA (guanine966-N2)-methyltransferase